MKKAPFKLYNRNNGPYRKRPTEADIPRIREMVEAEKTDREIAAEFKASVDLIRYRRREWGIPSGYEVRRQRVQRDRVDAAWLARKLAPKDIAETLGYSPWTVIRWLREAGVNGAGQVDALGLEAVALQDLRTRFTDQDPEDDRPMTVTFRTRPRWVLLPVEEYERLVSG